MQLTLTNFKAASLQVFAFSLLSNAVLCRHLKSATTRSHEVLTQSEKVNTLAPVY